MGPSGRVNLSLGPAAHVSDGSKLEFRYSQLNTTGETSNGRCSTTISLLSDGRLRMDDNWAWESKPGTGTSAHEEVR